MVPERNGRTDRRTDRQTDLLYQYRASVCWRAIKKTQTSPVPRTETSPTFTRRRVREDTRARLRHDACLDYCNSVLAWAPRSVTDKLQRVLNATARIVSGARKFDRGLSLLLHAVLHWLDVPERVQYKLGVTHRCHQHKAPQYLIDCVTPASDIVSRQRLRSASGHQLIVPRYQLGSLGRRSFTVAGPTSWILLSADLRDPTCSDEFFRRSLKTFLFVKY